MNYQYIAVDWQRRHILLSAESMASLNRLILSEKGQALIHQQAVWIYHTVLRQKYLSKWYKKLIELVSLLVN